MADLTQYNRVHNQRLESIVTIINRILATWDADLPSETDFIYYSFAKTAFNKNIIRRMTNLIEAVGYSSGLFIHVDYINKRRNLNVYDIRLTILKMNAIELEDLNNESDSD